MSYLVLARKWRPQTFDDVVGQEHVTRTLQNAIKSGRVAHGFLLCGTRGVGKTTTARLLAKALNCEKGPAPNPCNQCSNCLEITAGNAVDVLEIDGASNRGINEIRQIIENARYRPAKSRFKIYIIDEVHQVTNDAFNALLKTLEEPPDHVKFIFATTEANKVPQTILSRCQRYDFKRVALRQIAASLEAICKAEGIEITEGGLLAVAREAEGSMRDSQSLLDQVIAFSGKKIRDEDVVAALGVADRKVLYAVGRAVAERNPAQALEHLGQLHLFGYDLRRFARELLEHFRNLAIARIEGGEALLSDLADEERAEVRKQAELVSSADLDRIFRLLLAAEDEIGRSAYPKLILEMTVIRIATLPPVMPIDAVLQQLESLASGAPASASTRAAPPPRPPAASSAARVAEPAPAPSGRFGAPSTPAASPAPPASAPRVEDRLAALGKPPEERPAPVAAPAAPRGDTSWESFLDYARKEKRGLAAFLDSCILATAGEGELELGVPKEYHAHLSKRENVLAIQELAGSFYGRPMTVAMRIAEASMKPAKPAVDKQKLTQEMKEHPTVRTVLDILGGEVKDVKPRGASGE